MSLAGTVTASCFTKQDARAKLEELELLAQKEAQDLAEFSKARVEIEAAPELTIFLARELPDEALVKMGQKARALFGDQLFLDFKVDRELLGGAALVWKGKYRDYSLRAKFEEMYPRIIFN